MEALLAVPREKSRRDIENPSTDPEEPRPAVWDQHDSEERPVGYHYEEGLQYVNGSGKEECECGDTCSCKAPELDMNPFEDVPGYYPEGGNYHEDIPVAMASKIAADVLEEFPFHLRELVEKYKTVEKIPFQIQLGGKVLEIVVGDDKDLYLIYELQQQVIYGVKGLEQAPLLARVLALLVELWPTSVFEVDDGQKLRNQVMEDFMGWFLEFGEVSEETAKAAKAFLDSLKS